MAGDIKHFEEGMTIFPAGTRTDSHLGAQHDNDTPNDVSPLQLFQVLVGIHTPVSLRHDEPGSGRLSQIRSADNVGLYQRAIAEERRSRIAYILTSYISNMLYMLQILLAATFTALSAYKSSTAVTLTVLGALNTVLAGCLAWQKGQGVPQRYRKAQDQYQALIVEIEMAERSFFDITTNTGNDPAKLDPHAEKARLQKLFDTARADQQANYPDLYVSTGGMGTKEGKSPSNAKEETTESPSEMASRLDASIKVVESKLDALARDMVNYGVHK